MNELHSKPEFSLSSFILKFLAIPDLMQYQLADKGSHCFFAEGRSKIEY